MSGTEGVDDSALPLRGEPSSTALRFTVIDRTDHEVHLVSEVEGSIYAHPAVAPDVWQTALTEVPACWEIVDLCPVEALAARAEFDEFARGKHELFCAFLRAGFDRDEALALLVGLLAPDRPDEIDP